MTLKNKHDTLYATYWIYLVKKYRQLVRNYIDAY